MFYPDVAAFVFIGFVDAFCYVHHEYYSAFHFYGFCFKVDGGVHPLVGYLTNECVHLLGLFIGEACNLSCLVLYSYDDDTALAIGKCHQFWGYLGRIFQSQFELHSAVFSQCA